VKRHTMQKPQLLFFNDIYEEAQWVASKIKEENDEGLAFCQQAVLFRSAYISIPLQAELSRRNIPYQVFGGLKFYETAHVKDCLSHMKILNNCLDELAWNRSLLLIEGVGPKTSEKILEQIKGCVSLPAQAEALANLNKKEAKYSKELARLTSALIKASGLPTIAEKLEWIIDYYYPILKIKFDDWDNRLRDLETLRDLSARYHELGDFLADFAIDPPDRTAWNSQAIVPNDEKPLVLSTIHSAKGLEWDNVFFIGLVEGVLPVSFTLDNEEEIEEEHRLFYVGVTRARDKLFLSSHQEGSSLRLNQLDQISRFVDAPAVLERVEKIWYPT
ncbi:MAG: ATP-dependent helicase, partial [Candidatus Omnitrophica bacterium]|nr:ATP-dependent helicase [Candidatus Omnitrophota bacterium]